MVLMRLVSYLIRKSWDDLRSCLSDAILSITIHRLYFPSPLVFVLSINSGRLHSLSYLNYYNERQRQRERNMTDNDRSKVASLGSAKTLTMQAALSLKGVQLGVA